MRFVIAATFLLLSLSVVVVGASALENETLDLPPIDKILADLKDIRPRVMASPADFDRVRRLIESDDRARVWYKKVKERGEQMLTEPATAYEIPDGLRLLRQSRNTLDRALTLGMLYRIEGDARYRDRIWQDMEAAARFKDWNPRHFLDVAEMTCAFAVAYDWLHDAWSPEQRGVIGDAIVRHGLEVALKGYRAEKPPWWVRAQSNWSQVCNGGIAVGAVAVADVHPEMAAELVHHAVDSLPMAVSSFEPDGACVEGPGYWGYATRYYVYLLSTLEASFGQDFGLSALPAVDRLGDFPVVLCGTTNETFNFADCSRRTPNVPCLLWLALRFDRPDWAAYQVGQTSGSALDLLWYRPDLLGKETAASPLDRRFRRIDVAVMRSSWDDPGAWYLACKAGDNRFPHGHLDIGSFVLDALGQRWASDLGSDNYNLTGYWDGSAKGSRWTYYRLRAQGHNTLVIAPGDDPDQVATAAAKVLRFASSPEAGLMEIDMTPAYAVWAKELRRVFRLDRPDEGSPSVTVRDELELLEPAEVYWFVHTRAAVELAPDGRRAELRLGARLLEVRLVEPEDGRFEVLDAAPLPGTPTPKGQASNAGYRRLAVHLDGVDSTAIEVRFSAPPETATEPGSGQ